MPPGSTRALPLAELAERLACRLVGDGTRLITGVSTIERAGPSELTFLANPKYAPKLRNTKAAAVLAQTPVPAPVAPTLLSANPYLSFAQALAIFYQPPRPAAGIHATACIDGSARIGPNASIGPYAVVGRDVELGANAVLYPHAVIYDGCVIGDDFTAHAHVTVREYCVLGDRVTLHNGVVVGGDGFGFAKREDGTHFKIVQSGTTVIEDDVEIQTLSSVDRATLGETRIRRGAKLDSLVQIGHACTVGANAIICAQTGLAGSTVLEDNVTMAGQSGSAGHLTIHAGATVYGQAGVGGDVAPGAVVGGSPAHDAAEWIRASAELRRLPKLARMVRQLERRLQVLEGAPAPEHE